MKNQNFWLTKTLTFLLVLFSIYSAQKVEASHGMGFDLSYTNLGGNQYRIRLSFYRDCSGITESSSQFITVTNGCGLANPSLTVNLLAAYPIDVSPTCPTAVSLCSGGGITPAIQLYVYEGTVILPGNCANWVFSFTSCCRNGAITTGATSADSYYVEALLNNTIGVGNTSPNFINYPVTAICANQIWNYNSAATEPDGDILVYSFINPKTTSFATNTAYNAGFSAGQPFTTVPANGTALNASTGQITVTTPTTVGQVTIFAVLVEEYRGSITPANKVGHVMRDLQVSVVSCTNSQPSMPTGFTAVNGAATPATLTVTTCAGSNLAISWQNSDANAGQILNITSNSFFAGATFTYTGTNPTTTTFTWTPTTPGTYYLSVIVKDNNCPIIGQTSFAITIVVLSGTDAGPSQLTFCGQPVQLNAIGIAPFTWTLLGGGAPVGLSCSNCPNPIATPAVTTTYVVQSNTPAPCRDRDTITITVAPGFNITMNPPSVTICRTSSTVIGVTPNIPATYSYSWNPITALSNPNIQNPTANPLVTTVYTVTVTNTVTGCQRTGTVTVNVANTDLNVTSVTSTPASFPCVGGANTLTANVTAGDCNVYQHTSIAYAAPPAGGYTTDATTDACDDCVSSSIPIGFNFQFYCTTYTNIVISSNGFISFDPAPGAGCCSGQNIPDVNAPNNIVALCWTDLNPGTNGSIRYKTIGVAPNRQFIVFFDQVRHFGSSTAGQDVNGYIILNETTNNIDVMSTNIFNDGGIMTQGVERTGGTAAVPSPSKNASAWGAINEGARFAPTLTSYTVDWYIGATFIGTGSPFNTTTLTTTTYTASVYPPGNICTATASVTVPVGCPLPIDLTEFKGRLSGRDGILDWTTRTESHTKGFDIERSTDGYSFSKIGYTKAYGTTTDEQNYQFTDKNLNTGKYYYRLKIINMDGQTAYTNVVEMQVNDASTTFQLISMYPNPSGDKVTLSYALSKAGLVNISVMDVLGKEVLKVEDNINAQTGNHQTEFSVSDLSAGQYFVKCQHLNKNEFFKLSVTH